MSHQEQEQEQEEEEEIRVMLKCVKSLLWYVDHTLRIVDSWETELRHLPHHHQQLLWPKRQTMLQELREAARSNQLVLDRIVKANPFLGRGSFALSPSDVRERMSAIIINGEDVDKVRSTLKQIARDWSEEGAEERDACYGPILEELSRRFPDVDQRGDVRVLVPGSGLGRLPFEIVTRGFTCEGNEWSFHMLLTSFLILNRPMEEPLAVYPYIHEPCNNLRISDQLRCCHFPDVAPDSLSVAEGRFSTSAGDFVEVYGPQTDTWDVVVTCFFLDTARNVVQYVECIANMLKPGGVWINFGPLLFHYAGMDGGSVEITYEEVRDIMYAYGFRFEMEEIRDCVYASNRMSMMHTVFRCAFFAATIQKVQDKGEREGEGADPPSQEMEAMEEDAKASEPV